MVEERDLFVKTMAFVVPLIICLHLEGLLLSLAHDSIALLINTTRGNMDPFREGEGSN